MSWCRKEKLDLQKETKDPHTLHPFVLMHYSDPAIPKMG